MTAGAVQTPPFTILAGGSVTVTMEFAPTVVGARVGNLSVASNAASTPDVLPLSGTGTTGAPAPIVSLSVTTLTFSSTAVG